jgi:hypothetical protein
MILVVLQPSVARPVLEFPLFDVLPLEEKVCSSHIYSLVEGK